MTEDIFSEPPKPRKKGVVDWISAFVKLNYTTRDPIKTFEIYIAPFPKEGLFDMCNKWKEANQTYWDARHQLEETHADRRNQKDGYEFMQKQLEPYDGYLTTIDSIDQSFRSEKKAIFIDLATRLRSMMVQLRSDSLLHLAAKNYSLAKNAQKEKSMLDNRQVNDYLDKFFNEIHAIGGRYEKYPTSDEVRKELEELAISFRKDFANHLDKLIKVRFLNDFMMGKVGTAYVNTPEQFFAEFDSRVGDRMIFYYLDGMLGGRYLLDKEPNLQYTELDYGKLDVGVTMMISPVQLLVRLPERYAPIVQDVFNDISSKYEGRIIPTEDLRSSSGKKPRNLLLLCV